jgi:hypothetical protein
LVFERLVIAEPFKGGHHRVIRDSFDQAERKILGEGFVHRTGPKADVARRGKCELIPSKTIKIAA